MDFFQRQQSIQAQSRIFLVIFFMAVGLTVLALYFLITLNMIFIIYLSADLKGPALAQEPSLWAWSVRQLPQFIYGSPPEILSLRPVCIIGFSLLATILAVSIHTLRGFKKKGVHFLAQAMGGRLLDTPKNPKEKQFINVVEEMAVASSLPRPHLYIMDKEHGINAVTAGMDHEDVFIAVTAGALNHLSRDELQGVVAHEFAHIFNEDYHLNLIMAGWLNGLLFFYTGGWELFRLGTQCPRGMMLFGVPGLVLMLGGGLGKLSASMIQATFSRQREFLADAWGLGFTRNPSGLAGALKKIMAYPRHGAVSSGKALLMRSFFMASSTHFQGLFHTHPPVEDRIWALEPNWDGELPELDLAPPAPETAPTAKSELHKMADKGLAGTIGGQQLLQQVAQGLTPDAGGALVLHLLTLVGLSQQTKGETSKPPPPLGAELSEELRQAALEQPIALVLAVLISKNYSQKPRITKIMEHFMGSEQSSLALSLKAGIEDKNRLTLLHLVRPSVSNLEPIEREKLSRAVKALVIEDKQFDFFEIAACYILQKPLQILPSQNPNKLNDTGEYTKALKQACLTVLSLLAQVSTEKEDIATKALAAGQSHFNYWAPLPIIPLKSITSKAFLAALQTLNQAPKKTKNLVVKAAVNTAVYDPEITPPKHEILTALTEALDIEQGTKL